MSAAINYYRILGVGYKANEAEIKDAYRKLARKYHPDINNSAAAIPVFASINEAYSILSDSRKRKSYDLYDLKEFGEIIIYEDDIEDIYKKMVTLRKDCMKMDRYRINKKSIYQQLIGLLSDNNIALINNNDEALMRRDLIEEALGIAEFLNHAEQLEIAGQLKKIKSPAALIEQFIRRQRNEYFFKRFKFVIALVVTLILLAILALVL